MSSIILVEDEPDILMLMTAVLELDGHQVKAFPEADSAWNHIQQCGFDADLLITDLRMPGTIDGLQLVHNVHDLLPLFPVMVVSGFHASSESLDSDHVCWLQKPFALERLLELCHQLTLH
jgi:DNA-binding NtrC family response regulator